MVYGPQRLKPGTYSASPVLADGHIYVTNEDGVTSVFKAGPTFQVLAENALDEYTLSSLAVSNGQIFIRTEKHLYAIGQPAAPAGTRRESRAPGNGSRTENAGAIKGGADAWRVGGEALPGVNQAADAGSS